MRSATRECMAGGMEPASLRVESCDHIAKSVARDVHVLHSIGDDGSTDLQHRLRATSINSTSI